VGLLAQDDAGRAWAALPTPFGDEHVGHKLPPPYTINMQSP
jgi:hypothetical protein